MYAQPSSIDDKAFQEELRMFIKANAKKKGEKVMTLGDVVTWVTQRLQLSEEDVFSDNTIPRWVHTIGFSVHSIKKKLRRRP